MSRHLLASRSLPLLFAIILATLVGEAAAHDFKWVTQGGGTSNDDGWAVAVDARGNSYVTGRFADTATFGRGDPHQTTLTAFGAGDAFVAKYTPDGKLAWVKQVGALGATNFEAAWGLGIAVDAEGRVVVTGLFEGAATFGYGEPGELVLTARGRQDAFVASYGRDGELRWATRGGGGTSGDAGLGVALDAAGNAYVTGYFHSIGTFQSATFDSVDGTSQELFSRGAEDVFVAKYSRRGVLRWVKRAGSTRLNEGHAIAIDPLGDLVVTGYFEGDATFGEGAREQVISAGGNGRDVFVAKYSPAGALRWVKHTVGSGSLSEGRGLAVDRHGNIRVTGQFRETVTFGPGELHEVTLTARGTVHGFIANYDRRGNLSWARHANVDGGEAWDIALDAQGTSYVTGTLGGRATFGRGEPAETTLVPMFGVARGFLAAFDTDGQLLWAALGGGFALAVDDRKTIYIVGGFSSSNIFNPEAVTFGLGDPDATTLTPQATDIFLMKFTQHRSRPER